MRKLLYCAAALPVAGIFTLWVLSPDVQPPVKTDMSALSKSTQVDPAKRTMDEGAMDDGVGGGAAVVGREALPNPDTEVSTGDLAPSDSVSVYEALLYLNFAPDASLLVDRNTRAALDALYGKFGPDLTDSEWSALQVLLNEALPPSAAGALIRLIPDYFSYRQAAQDFRLAVAGEGGRIAAGDYARLTEMRRNYFDGAQADGLFAEEEAHLPYMSAAMAVAGDENLSASQRRQKLAELQQAFNRAASRMDSPLAREVLADRVRRMRASGASEADIFAVRSAVVGSGEAQRLAEADREAAEN